MGARSPLAFEAETGERLCPLAGFEARDEPCGMAKNTSVYSRHLGQIVPPETPEFFRDQLPGGKD